MVDEYSLDIKSLTTLDSLTETFEKLKADKNDYPVYIKNDGLYYIFDVYDQIGAGTQILGVRFDDKEGRVCFTLEEPDIMNQLKTIHEWNKKGIINPDAATLTEGRVYNMWRVAQGWESACVTSWGPQMGKDVVVQQIEKTILSNETVRGSLNMVSINTKYPEKCLQLLDLVNCDTKLRDLFYFGEEGVNFEYTADGKVHKINNEWALAVFLIVPLFLLRMAMQVYFVVIASQSAWISLLDSAKMGFIGRFPMSHLHSKEHALRLPRDIFGMIPEFVL